MRVHNYIHIGLVGIRPCDWGLIIHKKSALFVSQGYSAYLCLAMYIDDQCVVEVVYMSV